MKKIKYKLYDSDEYKRIIHSDEFLHFRSLHQKEHIIYDNRFRHTYPQLYLFLNNKILLEFESYYEYGYMTYTKEDRMKIRIKISTRLLESLFSLIDKASKVWT